MLLEIEEFIKECNSRGIEIDGLRMGLFEKLGLLPPPIELGKQQNAIITRPDSDMSLIAALRKAIDDGKTVREAREGMSGVPDRRPDPPVGDGKYSADLIRRLEDRTGIPSGERSKTRVSVRCMLEKERMWPATRWLYRNVLIHLRVVESVPAKEAIDWWVTLSVTPLLHVGLWVERYFRRYFVPKSEDRVDQIAYIFGAYNSDVGWGERQFLECIAPKVFDVLKSSGTVDEMKLFEIDKIINESWSVFSRHRSMALDWIEEVDPDFKIRALEIKTDLYPKIQELLKSAEPSIIERAINAALKKTDEIEPLVKGGIKKMILGA